MARRFVRGTSALRYRDAIRTWPDLGLPWDEALNAIDVATIVDPAGLESPAAKAAREILVGLEAAPRPARRGAISSVLRCNRSGRMLHP